jgi:hypothetical protein
MTASFDPDTLELTLDITGAIPQAVPVAELHEEVTTNTPGPFELKPGRQVVKLQAGIKTG